MSNIDITSIVTYNNLLALKKTKRRWLSATDKQQKESSTLTLFTITKQAQECDTLLIQYLLSICKSLSIPHLVVGSKGLSFVGNINKATKDQILQLFNNVHVDKTTITRYIYNDVTQSPSIMSDQGNFAHNRTVNTVDNIHQYNVSTTFVNITFNTRRSVTDTFFTDNSIYYGVYDTSTRTIIHSKTSAIVNFYFKTLSLLAIQGSIPLPSDVSVSAIDEIESFIKAIYYEPKRPWKAAAIKSMRESIRNIRWPEYKTLSDRLSLMQ